MQDRPNDPAFDPGGQTAESAASVAAQSANKLKQVRDQVANLGQKAVDRIEAQREPAAQALTNTASTLHERGDQIAQATGDATQAAADRIQRVADYLRSHDTRAMVEDAGNLVRRYPGQFLAAGAIFGFLVGRSLRRRDYGI